MSFTSFNFFKRNDERFRHQISCPNFIVINILNELIMVIQCTSLFRFQRLGFYIIILFLFLGFPLINIAEFTFLFLHSWRCMVVGFTSTYVISAYHHQSYALLVDDVQHYVIKFVRNTTIKFESNLQQMVLQIPPPIKKFESDLQQMVLHIPPPIKLTVSQIVVESAVEHQ